MHLQKQDFWLVGRYACMQKERTPVYNRIKRFGILSTSTLGCADQILCCCNSWNIHYIVNTSEVPAYKWKLTQLHIGFEPNNLFTMVTLSCPSAWQFYDTGTSYGSVLISVIIKGTLYLHVSVVRRKQFWCYNVTTNSFVFFCSWNHINPIKFITTAHCCQDVRGMRKLWLFFRTLRQKI